MEYQCTNGKTKWTGVIKDSKSYGNHYYLKISAKGSGISVYFGRAVFGQWFVAIPDWRASVIIGDLRQTDYNAEKIGVAMDNEIDGISVARGLYVYANDKGIKEIDSTQETLAALNSKGFELIVPVLGQSGFIEEFEQISNMPLGVDRDKLLSKLMDKLSRTYNIPIFYDPEWTEQHPDVMALFTAVSAARTTI